MFKSSFFKGAAVAVALTSFTAVTNAHEVWLERDQAGTVRVYLGPVEGPQPDHGKEIDNLKTAEVFTSDRKKIAPLTQKDNHFVADVKGSGDIRLYSEKIWAPWKTKDGTFQAAIMQARVGRTETSAKLDLEIVPVKSGSNHFTVFYKGKPVAGSKIMIISPHQWQKHLVTDKAGQVTVPINEKGRYIVVSHHDVDANREIAGQMVSKLSHVSTLSFIAK